MASEQEKHDPILGAFGVGNSAVTIVQMFNGTVSRATVFKVIREFKKTQKMMRKKHSCPKPVRVPAMT